MRTLRQISLLLHILFALATLSGSAASQVSFKIDITVTCGVLSKVVTLGVNPGNTIGIDTDPALGPYQEFIAPPLPQTVLLDARFPVGPGTAIFQDYRGYFAADQADIYYITVQGDYLLTKPLTLSWPATLGQFATSWTIKTVGTTYLNPTNMVPTTGVTIPPNGFNRVLTFQIVKVGAFLPPVAGPTLVLNQTSLYFGSVGLGQSASQAIKVTNTGATNPLIISGVTLPADYSISPAVFPATVPPGTDKTYTVTFTPTQTGTRAGNVVFGSNAPGDSARVSVLGYGLQQLGTLFFSTLQRTVFDRTTGVVDTLGIRVSGYPLHAVQFTLKTDGQLIFRSIRHTLDPAKWTLSSTVFRGSLNNFFATDDSINVVLYGNDSNSLPGGEFPGTMLITYDVVNVINPLEMSHLRLSNILGSLFDGTNGNVTSAGDETITVKNRTAKGDVNFDDHIDILDLLLVVDHITGKSTLTGGSFAAADLYPYPAGDGLVNVQDLSSLQTIILNGVYPDGQRTSKAAPSVIALKAFPASSEFTKVGNGTDARLTFHVTKSGIAVRLENAVPAKGMQIEFANVPVVPQGMKVTSALGEALYGQNNGTLTVLLYSPEGAMLEAGDRTVAVLPFSISDPTSVSVSGIVLAGEGNKPIVKSEAVLSNEPIQELPTAYGLEQNYPNPFNPSTDIRFSVPLAGSVKIAVYNLLGQEVGILVSGHLEQGTQVVRWDGKDTHGNSLSSGTYIYRMEAGTFIQTRKMLLVK